MTVVDAEGTDRVFERANDARTDDSGTLVLVAAKGHGTTRIVEVIALFPPGAWQMAYATGEMS